MVVVFDAFTDGSDILWMEARRNSTKLQ